MKIPKANNFDHIRLILALGVFVFHTAELTQLATFQFFKSFVNPAVMVHSFFIISGFLIFMSYEHSSSLKSYLIKRLRRIAPAYITVVVLLFITLSLISTLSFQEYFSSSESWQYLFYNLITLNFLQTSLPGVFTSNYLQAVDGSLWTIKIEVAFYLSLPIITYFYRWMRPTLLLSSIFILSILYYITMGLLAAKYHSDSLLTLQHQLPGQMLFFTAGALLYYQFQFFKKYQHTLFSIAILIFILQYSVALLYPLYALSLSIIIIYLATSIRQLGHIAKHGDLSYGIYIWHFPLIQIFIALGLFEQHPWWAFSLLTLTIITLAYLSWHYIEKPFLSKKSHYVKEEQKQ